MFGNLRKLYRNTVNLDGVNETLISDDVFVTRSREGEKLGLLRSEGDMVLVTVVDAELKEILQEKYIMGEQSNIICLTNSRDTGGAKRNSKTRVLGSVKVLIAVHNIEFTRGDSTLLKAKFILDGPKDLSVPFNVSLSVF